MIRTGIGVAVGASASFFIGLVAAAENPEPVLRVGLIVSLSVLAVLVLLDLVFGPWVQVDIAPVDELEQGTLIQIGLRNLGRREFGRAIVNVFVPATEELLVPEGEVGTVAVAPGESLVSGVRGSRYWNHIVHFVPGAQMFHVIVRSDRERLPIRVRVGNPRKDMEIELAALGIGQVVEFGTIRPKVSKWAFRRWQGIKRRFRRGP